MHEYGLAEEILAVALEVADTHGGRPVEHLWMRLGRENASRMGGHSRLHQFPDIRVLPRLGQSPAVLIGVCPNQT